MSTLNYIALEEMILQQEWWFTPSELHGIISALCAFDQQKQWQTLLVISNNATADELMTQLTQHINNTLKTEELRFQLLLTSDENITEYAESFTMWCQGFLLACAYLREKRLIKVNDKSIKQYLTEIEEFSKLDTRLENNETNQGLLIDLEEHCRLGVLMIYADYHRMK